LFSCPRDIAAVGGGKEKLLAKFSVNYAIKARRSIGKSAHERCNHEEDLKALKVVNNQL
jgi:hypothetical protein